MSGAPILSTHEIDEDRRFTIYGTRQVDISWDVPSKRIVVDGHELSPDEFKSGSYTVPDEPAPATPES